jgi:hypothetical protein
MIQKFLGDISVSYSAENEEYFFWNVALCYLALVHRVFRSSCCLHNHRFGGGSSKHLRNVGELLQDYTAQYPRWHSFSEVPQLHHKHIRFGLKHPFIASFHDKCSFQMQFVSTASFVVPDTLLDVLFILNKCCTHCPPWTRFIETSSSSSFELLQLFVHSRLAHTVITILNCHCSMNATRFYTLWP